MCLCPRCLIRKQQVGNLGTQNDRKRRKKYRVDNEHYQRKVARAREGIFAKGYKVTGAKVERMLGEESIAPTKVSSQRHYSNQYLFIYFQNAFTSKLSGFGFNLYEMMVVDLLHEFEIGVWKAIFTHLIRILYAFGQDTIQDLNQRFLVIIPPSLISLNGDSRYRDVPTFGRSTIRRFSTNVSAMKKLAARNFEDMLQVCLIVHSIPSLY